MNARRTEYHQPDVPLLTAILALCVFGLLMVFGSSMSERSETTYYFFHQVQNFVIGLVFMVVAFAFDYHLLKRLAYPAFALAAILLVAVAVVGINVEGAQRWLVSRSIQPSEFAKLAVILFAAAWLPKKGDDVRTLGYGLLPFGMLIGFIVGLVLRQPDLGTSMVILLTAGSLFLIAGAEIVQTFTAAGVTGLVLFVTAQAYQHARIGNFWDPCSGANAKLVQVCQGITAMGSGGLTGLSVGASRFRWDLHAPFSDSILGIIGEELGLMGTVGVVLVFGFVIYRGFTVALRTPDSFGRLTAIGITLWIGIQACINLGGNTALLPFTGVPLPFISYGGSSLVAIMAASGILLNISRQTQESRSPARGPLQRTYNAPVEHGRGNRGTRVPGAVGR
jgi:cell division protein FtsW